MATSSFLDRILDDQYEEVKLLEAATAIIKGKHAVKEDLLSLRAEAATAKDGISSLQEKVDAMKEENDRCKKLLDLLQSLNKRILHLEANVPPDLIRDYEKNQNTSYNESEEDTGKLQLSVEMEPEEHETPMKDCKKTLFNEPEVYPTVSLLTDPEFSTIPKYIIGRQSIETVNNLINTINQILKSKYTFLSLGKVQARKQGNLDLYLHYKKQQLDICNNDETIYFFTAEDYEMQTKSKLDKIKLNLLTVLRHCKRLREHRVKNDLRYIILTK